VFNAILIEKASKDSPQQCRLASVDDQALPPGDVLVDVQYSTLNYKDALAITGKSPIVRSFPMVPGIDLVGTVVTSEHPDYAAGDMVLLNGWGVGESHWGGLAQRARLRGEWLIPLPTPLSAKQTMMIGTAGYTAMLCIIALERHGIRPARGPVLVTGANGGVGSFAIALLQRLGYQVIASTGRPTESAYLKKLGAAEIIDRAELNAPGRPLAKERWTAAIDSVGSHTLANVCAATQTDGAVAACGLAQGMDLPASVAPFILRGISLLGINSVTRPRAERLEAWRRLAELVDAAVLEDIGGREIALAESIDTATDLLAGKVRGRVVVNVNR
jgi:acrylyl-CoA reductase (NADPH)